MNDEIFGEVISSYSRAQAIEDGELIDISALASEAGFRYPVAVSRGIMGVLAPWAGTNIDLSKPVEGQPLYGMGQSFNGRAWDLLAILMYEIRRGQDGKRTDFAPLFLMPGRGVRPGQEQRPVGVKMYAVCGPGDQGEPVITVMLPDED